jgi:broad specificity polyphosphatase/5'/3'-nucleotidase SurE
LWINTAIVSRQITTEVLSGGLPSGAGVLSVNMPSDVDPSTARRLTAVTPTSYGAFFRQREDGAFEHHYEGFERVSPSRSDGDIEALDRGEVSMTPLRFDLSAPVDPADRDRFEMGV